MLQELQLHLSQNSSETLASNKQYNDNQMYLAESYEDLLATAIINKVSTSHFPPVLAAGFEPAFFKYFATVIASLISVAHLTIVST